MVQEIDHSKLVEALGLAEKYAGYVRADIIDSAGRSGRPHTDEEDEILERLEKAIGYIKKAQFCVKTMEFRVSDDIIK